MDRQHKAGACKANPFNVGLYLYANNTQEEEEEEPPSFSFHLFFGTVYIYRPPRQNAEICQTKEEDGKKSVKRIFSFSLFYVHGAIAYYLYIESHDVLAPNKKCVRTKTIFKKNEFKKI